MLLEKKGRIQNVRSCNTQQIELQTIRSNETTQRTTQTGPSRPLPNTTLNTIPQRQYQYPGYETESVHYPKANHRPPPYNESCNTTGPHEAPPVVPYPYLAPYPQQPLAPYQQQASHHLTQQPPSSNSPQPSAPPYRYETHAFNTLEMNQGRQPNTSVALTSIATLPTQNPFVQASRQHGSNTGNWEALSDIQSNPAYEFVGAVHGGSDYDNMDESYEEVKTVRTPPPPS